MKFKPGIILSAILILPGLYAVVAWTVWEMNHLAPTWKEVETGMNDAVPMFDLPVTTKILVLLCFALSGVILGLFLRRGETRSQRVLRSCIVVVGILVVAALSFSLM